MRGCGGERGKPFPEEMSFDFPTLILIGIYKCVNVNIKKSRPKRWGRPQPRTEMAANDGSPGVVLETPNTRLPQNETGVLMGGCDDSGPHWCSAFSVAGEIQLELRGRLGGMPSLGEAGGRHVRFRGVHADPPLCVVTACHP